IVGHGRNRGSPVTWSGISGFAWGAGYTMRWGTNAVTDTNLVIGIGDSTVESFSTVFDSGLPTAHEAIATVGDSGGAARGESAAGRGLAGVLYAIYGYGGQPPSTSLYGNGTLVAELSFYRPQILAITSVPACDDGADDDGDGLIDTADPGCLDAVDPFETNALVECDAGFDAAADALVDWPDDLGCQAPQSLSESPECDDGVDNDGDGTIDWDG